MILKIVFVTFVTEFLDSSSCLSAYKVFLRDEEVAGNNLDEEALIAKGRLRRQGIATG